MKQVDERSYYGILGVTPDGAGGIQKAYNRAEETLDIGSPDGGERFLRPVDSQKPEEVSIVEVSGEEEPPLAFTALSVNVIEETSHCRGKTLKKIREGMGIDLKSISARTRVNLKILEVIEEEAMEKLPPMVYLKGFLKSYARCLGLNPQRVVEGYLQSLKESNKK